MGVKSAAFHSETLSPRKLVTRTLFPSNAAVKGPCRPLPVRVVTTLPVDAWTTVIELDLKLGTQMLLPSKTGIRGCTPTGTDVITLPPESSCLRLPGLVKSPSSATHILVPS